MATIWEFHDSDKFSANPVQRPTKWAINEGSRPSGSRATVQPEPDFIKEMGLVSAWYGLFIVPKVRHGQNWELVINALWVVMSFLWFGRGSIPPSQMYEILTSSLYKMPLFFRLFWHTRATLDGQAYHKPFYNNPTQKEPFCASRNQCKTGCAENSQCGEYFC